MVDKWEGRLERRPLSTGMVIAFCIIVFIVLVSVVLWGAGVLSSPARGAGDAFVEKHGAGNFITQQHLFVAKNEDYRAKLEQIKTAQAAVKAEQAAPKPADSLAGYEAQRQLVADQATVQQLIMGCQSDATEYNTASQTYLAEDFRTADLPYRLDYAACSAAATS